MKNKFKKGDIVKYSKTTILVTGPGNEEVSYPCFAGVVLKVAEKGDQDTWQVGYYSRTWTTKMFMKTNLDLSTLLPD